jgi:ribonuclease Z
MLSASRDNTALALRMNDTAVLVDCPGSVCLKLRRAGVDPQTLAAVVVTHGHVDHLYGLPSLIENLWMGQRREPLPLFAPEPDLPGIRQVLAAFGIEQHAAFLPMHALGAKPSTPFWERGGHRLFAQPVDHSRPTCAVRWDAPGGRRVVYSSDTRPVEVLAEFGRGADLFLHEATYSEAEGLRAQEVGHSTAAQAARIAARARARRLLLVHLAEYVDAAQWIAEASREFMGPVEVPGEGAIYSL